MSAAMIKAAQKALNDISAKSIQKLTVFEYMTVSKGIVDGKHSLFWSKYRGLRKSIDRTPKSLLLYTVSLVIANIRGTKFTFEEDQYASWKNVPRGPEAETALPYELLAKDTHGNVLGSSSEIWLASSVSDAQYRVEKVAELAYSILIEKREP